MKIGSKDEVLVAELKAVQQRLADSAKQSSRAAETITDSSEWSYERRLNNRIISRRIRHGIINSLKKTR